MRTTRKSHSRIKTFLAKTAAFPRTLLAKSTTAGFSISVAFLLLPFFFLFSALCGPYFRARSRVTREEFFIFNLDSLGHYLMEFIGLVDELGPIIGRKNIRIFFFGRGKNSRANHYLLSLLSRLPSASGIFLSPISAPFWVPMASFAETWPFASKRLLRPMHPTFSRYKPLAPGQALSVLGVEETAKFERYMDSRLPNWREGYCVLGIRDSAYYGDKDNHRNSPASTYVPAVRALLDKGISVVRMGRKVSEKFPLEHRDFLDLGWLGESDDYLDVLLWAHAKFAVGDSTGLTDAVALLGGTTFCATYPMDPRSFISSGNYFFSLQELRDLDSGKTLKLDEIVNLMNEGWNLGDERRLLQKGFVNVRLPSSDIRLALEWFLSALRNGGGPSPEQEQMKEILARHDSGVWTHYRKDALAGPEWLKMQSRIFPGSLSRLL